MKVIHVNFSGSGGGAAIAAQRINNALNIHCTDVQSELWVARGATGENSRCIKGQYGQWLDSLKLHILNTYIQKGDHSLNLLPSSFVRRLNRSDADVVNLHWINGELFSIEQLAKIKKPVVWTFHDMWPFCGCEHYSSLDYYINGYDESGSVPEEFPSSMLLRLAKWTFRRKLNAWKGLHFDIVCPSHWLLDCAKRSLLLGELPMHCIHNCIDTDVFKPLSDKRALRRKYNLPTDRNVILFGAANPSDKRKGWDLLKSALLMLADCKDLSLAIFGTPFDANLDGMDVHWLGRISDERTMAEVYNCADVMCVPSRMDNLPNTAVEAQACGLPVVAFDVGGLSDIVKHGETGYLARPFETDDFAKGIKEAIRDFSCRFGKGSVGSPSVEHMHMSAMQKFNGERVALSYKRVYEQALTREY